MNDPEKLTALKKAYAETILNTAKEAAARVMISEKKARGYQQELATVRDEALRTCLRLKQLYDSKVKEAEMISLSKQKKIDELEAQLGEAEDIVGELRTELRDSRYLLEKLTNGRQSEEEKLSNVAACEDSSIQERAPVVANGMKTRLNDGDVGLSRCTYKENKDPCCNHTLPSILIRHREAEALETELRKDEEKVNDDVAVSNAYVSPSEKKQCIKFSFEKKHKKDPEGGGSPSSSSQDDESSRSKRQKTGKKEISCLDSFNSNEPSRDSRRVAQVARQLLPFSE